MLALRPDLVDMTKAQNFASFQHALAKKAKHLRAYGPHSFGWKMSDLNQDGATGDAASATANKGHQLIEHSAKGVIELLQDIHAFDPGQFD